MRLKGMKQPPLQMQFYYFPEIKLQISQPKQKIQQKDCGFDIDIDTGLAQSSQDDLCYKVDIRIKTKEIKGKFKTYDLDILAVGFFKIDTDTPQDKRKEVASILGANLLYGAARELLYQLTSRSPYEPINLPTTSFVPNPKTNKKLKTK